MVENKSDTISESLLWETLKVVLRGEIISISARENKNKNKRMAELTKLISTIDRQCAIDPLPQLIQERTSLQSEYNILSTTKAERMLLQSSGQTYEYGDKASRLLSHQLKRQAASRLIHQIKDDSNQIISDPQKINEVFKTYYSMLYTSQPTDEAKMKDFLDQLNFPTINVEGKNNLEKPIEIQEITTAIKLLASGRAPGPDGFTMDFYKKFSNKLAPILLEVFNEALEKKALPLTLTQATITLLLKKGKEPTECGSYRPISLLNQEQKILAKVLALRLEAIIAQIISTDQTGFIKGRHLFFNIRKLLNIIHTSNSLLPPEAVISLDAEKAFDRVEWPYLFSVLRKFGFGETFVSWIQLLYSNPLASVNTNSLHSSFFRLARGTRQGCPLSGLLFAIAIQPLSIALKESQTIQGITRYGKEYKTSLYADDLLLYIKNPIQSIPAAEKLLKEFGSFSGYKVNLKKSICFPINTADQQIQQKDTAFQLSHLGFTYLGINITPKFSLLYDANFVPLIRNIKDDLQRWSNLPLSLAGRVQCVKMTIFPKFLYLVQCLPIFLPKQFFKTIDQLITSFIWDNKTPRISKKILQSRKVEGGLALPNFINYYWGANTHKINYWLHAPDTDWCSLELQSCHLTSLPALVYSSLPLSPARYSLNPIVLSTMKIWIQFRRHFKFLSPSTHAPIRMNHLFTPSTIDSAFNRWYEVGLRCFKDLYKNNVFQSFPSLCAEYNLPTNNFFRFLQIRNFVKQVYGSFPNLPNSQKWEKLLLLSPTDSGFISDSYTLISSLTVSNTQRVRNKWERELNIELTDDLWANSLHRVNSTTSCARLSLIQLKVVHRAHLSKARIAEMYPDADSKCDRCAQPQAHLTHMFWSCPQLQRFWSLVFDTLSNVLGVTVQPCPLLAIFGTSPNPLWDNNQKKELIAFATLLARRRILLSWKSPKPPSHSIWLNDVMYFLSLEKIKISLRGTTEGFYKTWRPFIEYFNNQL